MAQPPSYTRQYNFNDFQTTSPANPLPGVQIDNELNSAKATLDGLNTNIAKIQRDDGLLANQSVHKNSLDTDVLALIGLSGYTVAGDWAASNSYTAGTLVNFNDATYLATVAHTSGTVFATDKNAGKWILLANAAIDTSASAVDKFEGTGSQTAFTLSFTYTSNTDVLVFVNGALRNPGDDYSISGNTITFSTAPSTPSVSGNENVIIWGPAVTTQVAVTAANTASSNASGFATAASNSAAAALTSQNAAATSAATATTQANTSTTQAGNSATSAAAALSSQNAAAASESAASTSETNAAASAATATTQAGISTTQAGISTTQAGNSASSAAAAATSETNAGNSETAAATSEANAATSAATATTQAGLATTNGAAQVALATTQASTATTKASEASTSATNAATSASTASTQASNASTSASTASTEASNAASSASTASGHASTATTKASEAATSATNAATSASTASTQATNAGNSATDAASSASAASTSASNAASSLNSFNAVYSTGSSDPTSNLDSGDLFYNQSSGVLKVYTGSAWEQGVTAGSGFLPLTGGGLTGNLNFGDNDKSVFGSDSDFSLYHNSTTGENLLSLTAGPLEMHQAGTNSVLQVHNDGTNHNQLVQFFKGNSAHGNISTDTGKLIIDADGELELRDGGSAKLNTTSSGVSVTGGVVTSGNVGIGNSPAYPLDVSGSTNVAAFRSSGSNSLVHLPNSGSSGGDNSVSIASVNNDFYIRAGDAERFRITSGGIATVGGTSGAARLNAVAQNWPENALGIYSANISGQTNFAGIAFFNQDTDATVGNVADIYTNPTGTLSLTSAANPAIQLKYGSHGISGGTPALTVDSSGHIGIGITTPTLDSSLAGVSVSGSSKVLHIHDTEGAILKLTDPSSGANRGGQVAMINTHMLVNNCEGDAISFGTGNAQRMRLDSGGNLLVSTTTNTIYDSTSEVGSQISAGYLAVARASTVAYFNRLTSDGEIVSFRKNGTPVGSISAGNGDLRLGTGDVFLRFFDAGTAVIPRTAADATSNGVIDLGNTSNNFKRGYFSATVFAAGIGGISDTNTYINFPGSDVMQFYTAGLERMRLTSGGNIRFFQSSTDSPGLGNTTTGHTFQPGGIVTFSSASGYVSINRNSDGTRIQFNRSGNTRGTITTTSSGTTYNTTSDLRLKEAIEPLQATDKLMQMNPVSFNWKAEPDGPRSMGFIAQEMEELCPDAVSTDDTDEAMMSMDYGRITPILVSALQDAHRKIEQLESRLAAMEA